MTIALPRRARACGAPARVAAVLLALTLAVLPAAAQELNSRIEAVIANSKLTGAKVGVSVIDLSSGRVLADIRDGTPLIPASNMKVLTSGTALLVLGPEFVFKTELILNGEQLLIRGGGDPALADPAVLDRMSPRMSVEALVGAIASSVKQAGAVRISEVVVDDGIFDRQLVHPTWPRDQLDKWYCAEVSGLNFHTNVLSVFPNPAPEGAGRPPVVLLEPAAPWMQIENRARTTGEGKNSVWLTRDPESNRFTMFGEVRFPTKVPVEITLHEPALLAGQLIAVELLRAGVPVGAAAPAHGKPPGREQIQGAIGAVRLVGPEDARSGRTVAAVSTHIRDVLERCNNDSQNLYAECLIKRVGHEVTGEPGSWTNGSSVVRMTLAQHLGAESAASTVVSDGSGMSREDKVSPRTLAKWLDVLQKDTRFGEAFVESLATPGDGTLRRRFSDIKLHSVLRAKSGKLDGVRCLSGYLTDKQSGGRIAFSVMVNDLKEGDQALQALQFHEDVVAIADRWLASQRGPEQKQAKPQAAHTEPSQTRVRRR
jgi:serine-type D-Ala-D-Ala carboxypeptidase/endopeptidase (penicillin-binding protein 4)